MSTTTATATATTIGMKLDAFVSSLDSMPSNQLYGIIVGVTVLISFTLLGSGGVQEEVFAAPSLKKKRSPTSTSNQPQPKWFVLRFLNYVFSTAFVASVAHFGWHAQSYLQDSTSLLRFLVGWSLFLCYFFGFFGISFVDPEDLQSPTRYVRVEFSSVQFEP
jgi:quinol-cytochrome oxidoreductase complex cytochrome b subunit